MSGFSGINQFGSLTVNGQKIDFKKFDTNNDNVISQEEYENALKELKLDSVDFSNIDTNGDKNISKEEFAVWEQKVEMQNAVNAMKSRISGEFCGNKSSYIPKVTEALVNYINDFAAAYDKDVSNMATDFAATLNDKYEAIKKEILKDDPTTIESKVLEEFFQGFINPPAEDGETRGTTELPEATIKALKNAIETEANAFIKKYKGNNLEADLKTHLENFMNTADADKLKDETATLKANVEALGELDNNGDLASLKEYAKEFLEAALAKGIEIKLGGSTIRLAAAISTTLRKYTDSDKLKADLYEAIDNLSTVSKKEQIIADKTAELETKKEKEFTSIKGSEYKVDSGNINFNQIDGYYSDKKYETKGKDGNEDRIKYQARQDILNSNLKAQLKASIETMLKEKGISFDKIANDFENAFNDALNQAIEGITTSKTNHKWLNKNKKYASDQGLQTIINNLIENFNTNIENRINEKNASTTDFDLTDIDYSALGQNEDGETVNKSVVYSYNNNTKITGNDKILQSEMDKAITRLKPQMLKKAMAMCKANGVTFDNDVFEKRFDNAKGLAVYSDNYESYLEFFKQADTRAIVDNFTQNFKTSYTAWVDAEKAKAKNK